jgi:hypothetical protein
MKIVNLQANDVVVLVRDDAQPVVFPSQGSLQVRMRTEDLTENKVVKRGYWTHTRGLPKPEAGTLYIVSSLVAMFELFQNNRLDLLYPWGMVRHNDGRVIACRALCRPELPPTTT